MVKKAIFPSVLERENPKNPLFTCLHRAPNSPPGPKKGGVDPPGGALQVLRAPKIAPRGAPGGPQKGGGMTPPPPRGGGGGTPPQKQG